MKIVKDGEGETTPAPDRNESLKAQVAVLRKALHTRLWMNITGFRYVLAMLLVVTKLGIFAYIQPNPLADVSWFYVLLPAFVFELAIGAFVALALALGLVFGLIASFFYGGYYLIKLIYLKFVYRRTTNKLDGYLKGEDVVPDRFKNEDGTAKPAEQIIREMLEVRDTKTDS